MNIVNSFRKLFFYRQHPETALRYYPMVDLLRKKKLLDSPILEVGSGSYGIAPYLKKEVIGVDTSFDEPEFPLLKQVKGSILKIPFKDKEFEVVIISDVLEHLPPKIRSKSLEEAIRVTKKYLIISGPFGEKAFEQDKYLANYSLKKYGSMHPFFKEHLENGLPEVKEIRELLLKNKRVESVEIIGEFLNLKVREQMMKLFISKNKFVYYFYLKGLMFFVPLLRFFNNKPCYRTIMGVSLK